MTKTYGEQITECVNFLTTLDQDDLVELMMELALYNSKSLDSVIRAGEIAKEGLEDLEDIEGEV